MKPLNRSISLSLILILGAFLLLGFGTNGYSQMGHGMMRGGHMMEGGHMMGGHMMGGGEMGRDERSGEEGTSVGHRRVMNGMMSAMQDIAIMMRQMSVMMGNMFEGGDDVKSKAAEISGLLKDMSVEMNRIASMMAASDVSDSDVRQMQQRVLDLQDRLAEMRRTER